MKPSELLARIDERQSHIEEQLEAILLQTQMTNGRVTKLEAWRKWLGGVWFAIVMTATCGAGIAGLVFGILNFIK